MIQIFFALLVLFSSTNVSATTNRSTACQTKLKKSASGSPSVDHLKKMTLSLVSKDYLQRRADLATEDSAEQALIVKDLESKAEIIFDELLKHGGTLTEIPTAESFAHKVRDKMKTLELHPVETKRLEHFYSGLIGYLIVVFNQRIKEANFKRFLSGTQEGAARDFVSEVVDEHLLKLFLKAPFDRTRSDVFSEKAKFNFLAMVLKSRVRDALNKHRASTRMGPHRDLPFEESFDDPTSILVSPTIDPESRRQIHQLIKILQPRDQEVVDLFYFRGLSLEQISSHLEEPLGTIKSRLARLLQKLRDHASPEAFN